MKSIKKILTVFLILFCISILSYVLIKNHHIKNPDVNIVFVIDKNYPIYNLLTINSILRNSKENFQFYIIESDIPEFTKLMMKLYVYTKLHGNITFLHQPIYDKWETKHEQLLPIVITKIMIPRLIPKKIKKILYLDSDLLVTDDIKKLYDIELDGKPIGMVSDCRYPKGYIPEVFKPYYYNSGIMLLDLNMWRQENLSEVLDNYWQDNYDLFVETEKEIKKFEYCDQDLINIALAGRIKSLPQKWNVFPDKVKDESFKGIIHYAGIVEPKPWEDDADMSLIAIRKYHYYWNRSLLGIYKLKKYIINFSKKIN